MKTNNNTRKMVMTASFMALWYAATMVIRFQHRVRNGIYLYPGDAGDSSNQSFDRFRALAAGIGSALADFRRYLLYVPGLIKGAYRFCCGLTGDFLCDGRKTDRRW